MKLLQGHAILFPENNDQTHILLGRNNVLSLLVQPLQSLQALLAEPDPQGRYTGEKHTHAFGSGGLLTTCVTIHTEACSMKILDLQDPKSTRHVGLAGSVCSSKVAFTIVHLVLWSLKSKQNWAQAIPKSPVKAMLLHTRE